MLGFIYYIVLYRRYDYFREHSKKYNRGGVDKE